MAALALGLLGAEVMIPALISAAYRGESLSFLNDIITGQSQKSVEVYVAEGRHLARQVLLGFAVLGLVGYAWWMSRPATTAFGDRILSGDPELNAPRVLWLAAWFGALAGLIDALHFTLRHLIERHPARGFAWELVWMGPLSTTIGFCLVGLGLLLVVGLLVRHDRLVRPVSLSVCVLIFSALAVYDLLKNPRILLAGYAVILLSLGIGVALSRLSETRGRGFLGTIRMTTPLIATVLLVGLGLGLWTLPSRLEQRRLAKLGPAAPGSPNVLLIILDTARAQSMGLYGYERATTPNLERFAEHGVVFDRAIATSSWTLPSHASMFTGRYHFETSGDIGIPLDDTHLMLTEVLRDRGYATAAFAANYAYTTEASGLARGFARYEDFPIGWGSFIASSWISRAIAEQIVDLSDRRWRIGRKLAAANTDDFLSWLSSRPGRPFFAFINYIDPHNPYFVPEPFRSMFSSPDLPPPVLENTGPVTEQEMAGTLALYDATIANIDHNLGRIFEALQTNGIQDSTIVIVTSDHGEQFGEHGLMFHYSSLYMPLLHVPLLLVYPLAVPQSTRITRAVSIRDLPATILDLIPDRPGPGLPGESLSRFWRSEDAAGESPVLAEVNPSVIANAWEPVSRGPLKSLVIEDFHYIRNGDGVEELYDLSTDPAEQQNLHDAPGAFNALNRARLALDSILPPK